MTACMTAMTAYLELVRRGGIQLEVGDLNLHGLDGLAELHHEPGLVRALVEDVVVFGWRDHVAGSLRVRIGSNDLC